MWSSKVRPKPYRFAFFNDVVLVRAELNLKNDTSSALREFERGTRWGGSALRSLDER